MMRGILLTVSMLAGAAPCLAGSVVTNPPQNDRSTFVTITCAECPPVAAPEAKDAAPAVNLAQGAQTVTVTEEGGVRRVIRTDAFMGGSPVTFVSTSSIWMPAKDGTELAIAPVIDREATTAAIEPTKTDSTVKPAAAMPVVATEEKSAELRLSPRGT